MKSRRQTNWFGDGGLSREQHVLYTKNKLLDGKKNPEIIINRVPMQQIKGFNRKFGASFLSTSQSVPLSRMMNPFPTPAGVDSRTLPATGSDVAKKGLQTGARRHRRKKKLGGYKSSIINSSGQMPLLEGPIVGQRFGSQPLPRFADRRYRFQVMPPPPIM
jgi:hypothetical protein